MFIEIKISQLVELGKRERRNDELDAKCKIMDASYWV
jgi:hypothetical protein